MTTMIAILISGVIIGAGVYLKKITSGNNPDKEIEKNYTHRIISRYK
ncbi:MAG: hypothetical protein GY754_20250 [bacterium]|nr:hypothetical protein [bacterium]